jgi:hypothetical protein
MMPATGRFSLGAICFVTLAAFGSVAAVPEAAVQLEYSPAPVDNPLKGLVPYRGDERAYFPHTLEFNYIPYSALVKGYDQFDWQPLEKMLEDISSRGHQAVLRVVLEYPGRKGLIPEFLLRDGLQVTRWDFVESPGSKPKPVETPDYEDVRLRRSLQAFLAAFGRKYDGDPRIGFITAGLLGLWGEWHTWPREELFASKKVQREVLDAYEAAFPTTPVLLRYPVGDNDKDRAKNAHRRFGYHDDSFAWATLHTGRPGDEWFFMTALPAAGPQALDKWKTCPIGGEIRPEAWGQVFDAKPKNRQIQDIMACIEATHVTWLMDSGMFSREQPPERIRRAEAAVRRMGYEFHCPRVHIAPPAGGRVAVRLEVENRGVAPFYYPWKAEWGLLQDGQVVRTWPVRGQLTGLLPGDPPRVWSDTLELPSGKPGRYVLAIRVPNPLKTGQPLRFANATQDAHAPGWLSLGEVRVDRPSTRDREAR